MPTFRLKVFFVFSVLQCNWKGRGHICVGNKIISLAEIFISKFRIISLFAIINCRIFPCNVFVSDKISYVSFYRANGNVTRWNHWDAGTLSTITLFCHGNFLYSFVAIGLRSQPVNANFYWTRRGQLTNSTEWFALFNGVAMPVSGGRNGRKLPKLCFRRGFHW